MDFIISKGLRHHALISDQIKKVTLENWHDVRGMEFEEISLCFVGGAFIEESDGAITLFDGSAVGSKGVAASLIGISKDLRQEIMDKPRNISGCYVLVHVNAAREITIHNDYLSQYVVFYWTDSDGRFAISNNLFYLEHLLEISRVKTRRTIAPFISNKATSGGMLLGSGLDGIEILTDKVINIKRGVVEISQKMIKTAGSYMDNIDRAAYTIDRHVTLCCDLAIERDMTLSFDVTGGMDSRMVFSSLFKNRLHNRFGFRSIFHYPHPDGHYAAMLAERYHLYPTEFSSYPDVNPIKVLDADLPKFRNYLSYAFNPVEGNGIPGAVCDPALIQLSGCFGEFSGASPDTKRALAGDADGTVSSYFAAIVKRLEQLGNFFGLRPVAKEWVCDVLRDFLSSADTHSHAKNVLLDLYRLNRSRSHFSFISRNRNRLYVHPDVLCTPYLYEVAQHLTLNEMIEGKANFDITMRLGGEEVVSLPLAGAGWGRHANPNGVGDNRFITRDSDRLFSSEPRRSPRRRSATNVVHPLGRGLPKDLRERVYLIEYCAHALRNGSAIFKWFDVDKITEIVRADMASLDRRQERLLLHAAHAFLWIEGDEAYFPIHPPVSNVL